MEGCEGVIHLAAHLWDIPAMHQINAESTGALASAASRSGVRIFCLASSISVYGSAVSEYVNETSPVVPIDRDDKALHRGSLCDRTYARSKVAAEAKLNGYSDKMECVVLRPPIVADLEQYRVVLERQGAKFFVYGSRREQFIYIKDVAHVFVWFFDRAAGPERRVGLATYNLCYAEDAPTSGAELRALAYELTGASSFRPAPKLPLWAYNLIEMVRTRRPSRRYSLAMMRFSDGKFRQEGYGMPWGLRRVITEAVS